MKSFRASKCEPPVGAIIVAQVAQTGVKVDWADSTALDVGDGVVLNTSASIIRYFSRSASHLQLYPEDLVSRTQVDHWLTFSIGPLRSELEEALAYLNKHVAVDKYLVGSAATAADYAVFGALFASSHWRGLQAAKKLEDNLMQWYAWMEASPEVKPVIAQIPKNLIPKAGSPAPAASQAKKGTKGAPAGKPKQTKDEGKFVELPGAEMGNVVTRFPPEASGYLHIGHAKAAMLNQHYRDHFQGKLILRFDDTNPAKEKEEFEDVILHDLKLLHVKYDHFSRTSDHFETMLRYCEKLLKEGNAYVDDSDAETMKAEREARKESKNRGNAPEKNLSLWEEMKKGSELGQRCAVRAKINMQSDNGALRDPTIYRCKLEPHPSTGTKYKVYPTYDFACPIVDSIEGVTHALRTTEYMDRDDQFFWFIDALGLRKPHIYAYSRLSMTNTVMSKRKLTWFVDSGIVDGWDDPRFPTVRGVLRRGLTIEALKQFILAQGSSRSVVFMEWDKIWAMNKKVIDPVAPRYSAVDSNNFVRVNISNAEEEAVVADKHPKNPSIGKKTVFRSNRILIDAEDAELLQEGENATFVNWGNILVKRVQRSNGKVTSVEAETNLGNTDYKKTVKLTWLAETDKASFTPAVCIYYDHIITKPVLEKDDDFKKFIGKDTKYELSVFGDPELKNLKSGEIIQIQRKGNFIVDSAYKAPSPNTCKSSPIRLISIPDGTPGSYGPPNKPKADTEAASAPSSKGKSNRKDKGHSTKAEKKEAAPSADTARTSDLNAQVEKQGNLVRKLKADKADKQAIDKEVKTLLELKAQYKEAAGTDWKPLKQQDTQKNNGGKKDSGVADAMTKDFAERITAQGDLVRKLKAENADKSDIEANVKILLNLKAKFKEKTGEDYKPPADKGLAGAGKKAKKEKTPQPEKKSEGGPQKQTRLGMEAKKEENLADWYSQVITKAELLEYYDVSGCYILRPWSYSIWEAIQGFFDPAIKKLGVQNCYFPIFVSKAALEREKDHIDDFAPEVAWVTKSGDSDLAEPIAVRPTSETVMYPAYAKWIQSHRDLPLRLNQWNNVVRWEFKHPQPFLRTREFLWQEGHSAFATQEEAKEEVMDILNLYKAIYEDLLAIPVVPGRKTEKEKFAGGDYTTTVEAYISAAGRAIQGATSHHLGQNFSKMFDVVFEDPKTEGKRYVYQNSWGITTRTIGVLIMVHGDNQGLVLPPNVSCIQVVIVPCGITASLKEHDRLSLYDSCKEYERALAEAGVRVRGDYRENYSPGWKFNHWELKGVPIRLELGPRDVKSGQFVAVRRDTGEKITLKKENGVQDLQNLLRTIQQDMFNKAKAELDSNLAVVENWSDFVPALEKGHLIQAPFCGIEDCEDKIKDESKANIEVEPGAPSMGAKSLCIPFKQPKELAKDCKCVFPACKNKPKFYTLFGRSY